MKSFHFVPVISSIVDMSEGQTKRARVAAANASSLRRSNNVNDVSMSKLSLLNMLS